MRLARALALLASVGGCSGVGSLSMESDAGDDTVLDAGPPTPVCGNGNLEGREQCDDGDRNSGDGCSSRCQEEEEAAEARPACGNGVREAGEECDDGNLDPSDGCDQSCQALYECGNGLVEPGEVCDPPNGDDCDETCAWLVETLPPPVCPNGIKEAGEDCDDGNFVNGDDCSSKCRFEVPVECGNDIVEAAAGEQCEPPGSNGCGDDCTYPIQPQCGNGIIEQYAVYPSNQPPLFVLEECDDGNTADGDDCSATCMVEILEGCTNGVVEPDLGEECDDGNFFNSDGCSTQCKEEVCGDGIVQSDEQCDDGNFFNKDGCSTRCTFDPPDEEEVVVVVVSSHNCGNGVEDEGEECDDGNRENGDGCSALCETKYCGNGIVEEERGEECDDVRNSSVYGTLASGACSALCKLPGYCGDGIRQYGYEMCDDGNIVANDGCDARCRLESTCGNGRIEFDEQCDDGNTVGGDDCAANCFVEPPPNCGDGFFDPADGEECEDGNFVPGDGCSPSCRLEVCGNAIRDPGEECETAAPPGDPTAGAPDAGPFWNWDAEHCDECLKELYCGDGVTSPGEECDDQGDEDGGCSDECTVESLCGDGHLDTGEECDDRNNVAGDGCDPDCLNEASCGDGVLDAPEECDDGNVLNGDTCSSKCRLPTTAGGGGGGAIGSSIVNGTFDVTVAGWFPSQTGNLVRLVRDGRDADGSSSSGSLGVRNMVFEPSAGAALVTNAGTQCVAAVPGAELSLSSKAFIGLDEHDCARAGVWIRFFDSTDCTGPIHQPPIELSDSTVRGEWVSIGGDFTVPSGVASMLVWLKATKSFEDPDVLVLYDNIVLSGAGEEDPVDPGCGDGVLAGTLGEECDDGNITDGDGCDRFCNDEVVCGDGIRDSSEQCDDGNVANNDTCSVNCTPSPVCGNRAVEAGEECDDDEGARGGDGCSRLCRLEVVCGNGVLEPWQEDCDDGNFVSGDGCSSHCKVEPMCGNGELEGTEECDDGNLSSDDGCSQLCITETPGFACGDGIVQSFSWYEYDIGPAPPPPPAPVPVELEDGEVPGICGNQLIEAGEACDDGNRAAHDGCDPYCQLEPALCGNGVVQIGEGCDDGNRITGDGCDVYCRLEPICGDGDLEPREPCDDGNLQDGDGCSSTCQFEAEVCEFTPGFAGSQYCRPGTCTPSCYACQVDYYNRYEPTANASCETVALACYGATGTATDGPSVGRPRAELCQELFDCVNQSEIVVSGQPTRNCFPEGDPVGCLCVQRTTGGVSDPFKDCFDGAPAEQGPCALEFLAAAETNDYELALARLLEPDFVLGTALQLAECSDAHCAASCTVECGNGYIEGKEECDDGNTVGGDGCSVDCLPEVCGDGKRDEGEQCDWGDPANATNCNKGPPAEPDTIPCTLKAGCGDGELQLATDTVPDGGVALPPEECDDKNIQSGDGCSSTCEDEYCGDGIWQPNLKVRVWDGVPPEPSLPGPGSNVPNEECDDGNQATGDGCTPGCKKEVSCEECVELRCASKWKTCDQFTEPANCSNVCNDDKLVAMGDCIIESECSKLETSGGFNTLECFCPAGMNALDCAGWDPNYPPPAGPCFAEIRPAFCKASGAQPASMSDVMFNWVDPEFPGGAVNGWLQCRAQQCRLECGVTTSE